MNNRLCSVDGMVGSVPVLGPSDTGVHTGCSLADVKTYLPSVHRLLDTDRPSPATIMLRLVLAMTLVVIVTSQGPPPRLPPWFSPRASCLDAYVEALDQLETDHTGLTFIPRCDLGLGWRSVQCMDQLGMCWCVNNVTGLPLTSPVRGQPDCDAPAPGTRNPTAAPEVCPGGVKAQYCAPFTCLTEMCAGASMCLADPCNGCKPVFMDKNKRVITNCQQKASTCTREVISIYQEVLAMLRKDEPLYRCALTRMMTTLAVTGNDGLEVGTVSEHLLLFILQQSVLECYPCVGDQQRPPIPPGDRRSGEDLNKMVGEEDEDSDASPPSNNDDMSEEEMPPPPGGPVLHRGPGGPTIDRGGLPPPLPGGPDELLHVLPLIAELLNISSREALIGQLTAELRGDSAKKKVGVCPVTSSTMVGLNCTEGDDSTCLGMEKCCPTGTGHKCVQPILSSAGVMLPQCRPSGDNTHSGYQYKQCFSSFLTTCVCVDALGNPIPGTIRVGGDLTCGPDGIISEQDTRRVTCPAGRSASVCKSSCRQQVACESSPPSLIPTCHADMCNCNSVIYTRPSIPDLTKGLLSTPLPDSFLPSNKELRTILSSSLDNLVLEILARMGVANPENYPAPGNRTNQGGRPVPGFPQQGQSQPGQGSNSPPQRPQGGQGQGQGPPFQPPPPGAQGQGQGGPPFQFPSQGGQSGGPGPVRPPLGDGPQDRQQPLGNLPAWLLPNQNPPTPPQPSGNGIGMELLFQIGELDLSAELLRQGLYLLVKNQLLPKIRSISNVTSPQVEAYLASLLGDSTGDMRGPPIRMPPVTEGMESEEEEGPNVLSCTAAPAAPAAPTPGEKCSMASPRAQCLGGGPVYYYNATTATCQMMKGVCKTEKHQFKTIAHCQQSCQATICPSSSVSVCSMTKYQCPRTAFCRALPEATCAIDPCTCRPVFYYPGTNRQLNCNQPGLGLCERFKATVERVRGMRSCLRPMFDEPPPPPPPGPLPADLRPIPGQGPPPGQQRPPQSGQQRPPQSGQQRPPQSGQQRPPQSGQQRPPQSGQQRPPQSGQQRPPQSGQQRPPQSGQQRPPPGQQRPPPGQAYNPNARSVRGWWGELSSVLRPDQVRCSGDQFQPMQCAGENEEDTCWCVNPLGRQVKGRVRAGRLRCAKHKLRKADFDVALNGSLANITDRNGLMRAAEEAFGRNNPELRGRFKVTELREGSIHVIGQIQFPDKDKDTNTYINNLSTLEDQVDNGEVVILHEQLKLVATPGGTIMELEFEEEMPEEVEDDPMDGQDGDGQGGTGHEGDGQGGGGQGGEGDDQMKSKEEEEGVEPGHPGDKNEQGGKGKGGKLSQGLLIGLIAGGAVLALIIIVSIVICVVRCRGKKGKKQTPDNTGKVGFDNPAAAKGSI